ncbi:hypothetical protein D0865_09884 [Lecanosticta acicola]|uniref:Amidase domain-containing protein n=1 Tax=Lecanosticta acicola TaxID=111012 RepID=A0AAI8Z4T7_9PEZI|nr:hypothetical protein D0865_09884 [Lecanosticta acicola]
MNETHLTMDSLLPLVLPLTEAFDPREATIASTHHALYTGLTTCREVVSSFLSRVEELNHNTNAIITLNPHALQMADDYDTKLRGNDSSHGPLFCVPTLLKDNYDTADMPTTGSNLGLANSRPATDAPAVKVLKDAGAVILGKTNLHELALEGLTVSSLGGQTLNPYDKTRAPGGSSGGTGAAVAASFAVFGTGSDTVNSLRSPASANSLYSVRPTRGLISRDGIMPVSYTQDAVGPITRCVGDLAVALTVMSSIGYDEKDNTTALVPAGIRGTDYTSSLSAYPLTGMRFGLVEGFLNRTPSTENDPVNEVMQHMVSHVRAAGAKVVSITDNMYNSDAIIQKLDTQRFEYRESMDAYLQRKDLGGEHPTTLNELYGSGMFLVIPAQHEYVSTALVSSTSNSTGRQGSYQDVRQGIQNLTHALHETFKKHDLDALIYPEQRNLVVPVGSPSQRGRNGILAALTGSPVVTVPAGYSNPTKEATEGVPIGMEMLGLPWTEGKLLGIAWQMERMLWVERRMPHWAKEKVEVKTYETVPNVRPNTDSIPREYPLGVLLSE